MHSIDKKDIQRLKEDPTGFAMMMEDDQIEHVISAFVSVLNERIKDRGG